MNLAWFVFYGRKEFGMGKQEVYWTPYGEFMDLLACLSVYEGVATQKKEKRTMDFTEFLKLQ